MIKYRIIVQHTSNQKNPVPFKKKPGESGYQESVLTRALNACKLKLNEYVKAKGTPRKGTIVRIEDDINKVNWTRNQPHFIEVKFDDGVSMMCHHSQLKRIRKL